jgi:hypothetical protein
LIWLLTAHSACAKFQESTKRSREQDHDISQITKMGFSPKSVTSIGRNTYEVTFRADDDAKAFAKAARALGHQPAVFEARFDDDAFVQTTL